MLRTRINLLGVLVFSAAAIIWSAGTASAAPRPVSHGGFHPSNTSHGGFHPSNAGFSHGGQVSHGSFAHSAFRPGFAHGSFAPRTSYSYWPRNYSRGYYGGHYWPYYNRGYYNPYYAYSSPYAWWNTSPYYGSWWFPDDTFLYNSVPSYYSSVPGYSIGTSDATIDGTYSNGSALNVTPAEAGDNRARIHMTVPANATVWVQGYRTTQTGSEREFMSPPLTPGKDYSYDVRVAWKENGAPVERTRTLTVHANEAVNVSFMQSP